MIDCKTHAEIVQRRRVNAGKNGIAKAVRRFLLRYGGDYQSQKRALPQSWDGPKKKVEAAA